LIKVSGNEAILDEAAFREAVGSAQEHVLLYSYREDEAGDVVFLEFDDAFVRSLFRDESVPYWEQRRPPVVVWIALDEPSHGGLLRAPTMWIYWCRPSSVSRPAELKRDSHCWI
jgi:hypothetical protein